MERSLQQQYGIQKDVNALWDQLKEDYKSKMKLNVCALWDEMSAGWLSDCEKEQEYASKIHGYVNDFNLCADSDSSTGSGGTMAKSKHTYYLMKGIPKDDGWPLFTQLMYDMIDTLADKPEEVIMKRTAYKARQLQEVDLESIELLPLAKTRTKSEKWNSKQTWKTRKTCDSDNESDGSCSESEKHRRRHTQECYRRHKLGHIAWDCPSTAPVES